MNSETMQQALEAGKILRLLAPLAEKNTVFGKALSRLRSNLDVQLGEAVVSVGAFAGNQAAAYIGELHVSLLRSTSEAFDLTGLLKCHADGPVTLASLVRSVGAYPRGTRLSAFAMKSIERVLALKAPALERSQGADQARSHDVAHRFSSLVRNASWMPLLLKFGLPAKTITEANELLVTKYGSRAGQELVQGHLKALGVAEAVPGPVAAKPSRKKVVGASAATPGSLSGYYETTAGLTQEKLLLHPEVRTIMATLPSRGMDKEVLELLMEATQVVTLKPSQSVEVEMRLKLDTLLGGLQLHVKELQRQAASVRKRAAELQKTKTLEALRGMGPLLEVLKANPGLLTQA